MAYVGYEYVRSSLDLPIFEVSRPAIETGHAHHVIGGSTWRAGCHGAGRRRPCSALALCPQA